MFARPDAGRALAEDGRYPRPISLSSRAAPSCCRPHEETFTFHATRDPVVRNCRSSVPPPDKDRDEPRRAGPAARARVRHEGSYSFDRDEAGLSSFEAHPTRTWNFDRCGLETTGEGERGDGRLESDDYLAPPGRENLLVRCENGDYAAADRAGVPRAPSGRSSGPERIDARSHDVEGSPLPRWTRGDVEGDAGRSRTARSSSHSSAATTASEDKLMAIPGDSGRRRTRDPRGLRRGAIARPVGFEGQVSPTDAPGGQFVAGANRDGWHLRGVEAGRDYEPRFADVREPKEGDTCPIDGGRLVFQTAVEVGHIFNFGSFYSKPLDATFLDEDGAEKPLLGGSYGIGPGRVMAAIIEQRIGEDGMVWPREVSPYDVHVVVLAGADEIGGQAAEALSARGLDVLLDDRDLRAGEKFADADLIGCPLRVTAGKKSLEDGKVDVRDRTSGEEQRLDVADLGKEG